MSNLIGHVLVVVLAIAGSVFAGVFLGTPATISVMLGTCTGVAYSMIAPFVTNKNQ